MKNLILAALVALPLVLASQAQASEGKAGRAGCGSDKDNVHSVQFGWDDKGQLTDVSLTRADEEAPHTDQPVVEFDLKKVHKFFEIKGENHVLTVYDGKGNWVALNVSVDEQNVGKGEISWGVGQDDFKQKQAPATCSFSN